MVEVFVVLTAGTDHVARFGIVEMVEVQTIAAAAAEDLAHVRHPKLAAVPALLQTAR